MFQKILFRAGDTSTAHYDPLLAKVLAHGQTRVVLTGDAFRSGEYAARLLQESA